MQVLQQTYGDDYQMVRRSVLSVATSVESVTHPFASMVKHPVSLLLGAGMIGFCMGRLLRRAPQIQQNTVGGSGAAPESAPASSALMQALRLIARELLRHSIVRTVPAPYGAMVDGALGGYGRVG